MPRQPTKSRTKSSAMALWAKAWSDAHGDDVKARALYIKYRVDDLRRQAAGKFSEYASERRDDVEKIVIPCQVLWYQAARRSGQASRCSMSKVWHIISHNDRTSAAESFVWNQLRSIHLRRHRMCWHRHGVCDRPQFGQRVPSWHDACSASARADQDRDAVQYAMDLYLCVEGNCQTQWKIALLSCRSGL